LATFGNYLVHAPNDGLLKLTQAIGIFHSEAEPGNNIVAELNLRVEPGSVGEFLTSVQID